MIPTLIYREGWREGAPARPITQEHVSHADLILSLHGPGSLGLKKSHHSEIAGEPYYIWSGKCEGNWALSLRHKRLLINLKETGTVRWCSKQSGGHRLKLIVKSLAGPWMVSDQSAGPSVDWREFEFRFPSLSWHLLDIEEVEMLGKAPAAPLMAIDAIGFTDLKRGGGSEACSRLAWIEVWGSEVPRGP